MTASRVGICDTYGYHLLETIVWVDLGIV